MVALESPLSAMVARWKVHGALITAQVLFGSASIVGALGLPSFNPLVFALIRELAAGALLLVTSILATRMLPTEIAKEHLLRFAILGLCIAGTQGFFIIGIKLSSGLTATIWQPTQPIITATLSMATGQEPKNWLRVLGVLLAFGGVLVVALASSGSDSSSGDGGKQLAGNVCLFLNCLTGACYIMLSKEPLKYYPPLCVSAWSYCGAAVWMTIIALSTATSTTTMHFLCTDCEGIWVIPLAAVWAMCYWIVFSSAVRACGGVCGVRKIAVVPWAHCSSLGR